MIEPSVEKPKGEVLLQISNAISALKSECYGKGPARAKTYEVDNVVVVVMQGGLIDAEKTLVNHGQLDAVREFRLRFDDIVRDRMIEIVEEALGRRVRDHASQVLSAADVQVELFVLE